ncbi:hypothetical protein F3Y22_tig00110655pilonHSYRG00010 [Hibiscus syriacus]|uniref:Uncharacterized protein n=1 Tax=Hibiscus syriacus TaxID=106335 RepID=A0A6A2ZXX6_HIBSY|nr:hypothetical protein F3Y22_tig00110655pilonHSYRG00010 [Hibiscus syriacus]
METGTGASGDSSPNLPLLVHDGEPNVSDDARLNQLGYKQELSRRLSAIANFSVTFSIISVLTGLSTMYGTGLAFAF